MKPLEEIFFRACVNEQKRKLPSSNRELSIRTIGNIIVFQKRMIEINTAMQKMKNLKIFLCTQERVRREYRDLIFCVC